MAVGWFSDYATGNAAVNATIPPSTWGTLSEPDRTAYLIAAYNRIRMSPLYALPTSPSVDQLERLKIAQAETAAYMCMHKADENSRAGLQAQGVRSAGIVSESYVIEDHAALPAAAISALSIMRTNNNIGMSMGVINRDDSEYLVT